MGDRADHPGLLYLCVRYCHYRADFKHLQVLQHHDQGVHHDSLALYRPNHPLLSILTKNLQLPHQTRQRTRQSGIRRT